MIIEQRLTDELEVLLESNGKILSLIQNAYEDTAIIELDKTGAKQLIKVLQEFVGKDKDKESEALRLNNLR